MDAKQAVMDQVRQQAALANARALMEACGDVLTKKKLDPHRNQCHGASFTCLDCMVHFYGTEYRAHTSCISEAQKYQGHLYRERDNKKANKSEKRKSLASKEPNTFDEMVPKKAYMEEVPDEGENAVAVVDVPPRAPTPPAVEEVPDNVNVFDFLVTDGTPQPNGDAKRKHKAIAEPQSTQHSQRLDSKTQRLSQGVSYGHAPVQPGFERYDSWSQFPQSQHEVSQQTQPAASEQKPAYITQIVTPGPDRERRSTRDEKSDKKRKRGTIDELDLSAIKRPSSRDEPMTDAPNRILHTGLTGGLTRLVTDSSFYEDRIEAGPTPVSPIKRSKRDRDFQDQGRRVSSYGSSKATSTTRHSHDPEDRHRSKRREHNYHDDNQRSDRRRHSPSTSSDDHRSTRRTARLKTIEFIPHDSRNSSVQPTSKNQLIAYWSRAELFLSFVTKGPESERGCSINKALKRYHRECPSRSDEKDDDDKELWKSLRLRRNERGEVVLFCA